MKVSETGRSGTVTASLCSCLSCFYSCSSTGEAGNTSSRSGHTRRKRRAKFFKGRRENMKDRCKNKKTTRGCWFDAHPSPECRSRARGRKGWRCLSHLLLRFCSLGQEEGLPHSQALKEKSSRVRVLQPWTLDPGWISSDLQLQPEKKTEACERAALPRLKL